MYRMHPMFNSSGIDKVPLKENLPGAKPSSPKRATPHSTIMRDMQVPTKPSTSRGKITANNLILSSEDDVHLDTARPASRTDTEFASSRKPPTSRSDDGKTATASRPPALEDDLPTAGASHPTVPNKPPSKMAAFTYREYFPRPIVRYITNAAEADELVEALNGYVWMYSCLACSRGTRGRRLIFSFVVRSGLTWNGCGRRL